MWCLEERAGRCIYILPNCKKSFGKSLSDIKLEGDATVSRLHATISVEPIEESETQFKCVLSDSSKYGTHVFRDGEMRKLSRNERFVLVVGDRVQFGLKDSIFTVKCHTFVITRSSLSCEEMEILRDVTRNLGQVLFESWQSSCTHLTVSETLLFTTKLACALASAKPIVTLAYWKAIEKAVEESKKLPEINDFLPTIKDEWLDARSELLLPKTERRTLFRGLSFVHFCTKQYFAYAPLITAAGGKSCVYPTKKPLTPRDLTAKNAVVVQQSTNDSTQFTQVVAMDYPIIYSKLNALKRRMVSDREIPLAILYCSTEKYCNPKFDFGTLLKSTIETFSPSGVVIVEDTQDTPPLSEERRNEERRRIIPETGDSYEQYHDSVSSRMSCSSSKNENERKCKNVSGTHGGNIIRDIFSSDKNDKRFHTIIPETCDSFDQSEFANDTLPSKSKPHIKPPESSARNTIDKLCVKREERQANVLRKNAKFQREEHVVREEDNFTFEHDNSALKQNKPIFGKNKCSMPEGDDPLFMNYNNSAPTNKNILNSERDNSIRLENENLVSRDHKNGSDGSWMIARKPRIVSIEKIDNGCNRLGKNCVRIEGEFHNSQEKEPIRSVFVENQKEIERTEQLIGVNERDEKEEEKTRNMETRACVEETRTKRSGKQYEEKPRKRGTDWYEKYINCELTNEILRKDTPHGKIFAKIPVSVPTKRLKMDDFVL